MMYKMYITQWKSPQKNKFLKSKITNPILQIIKFGDWDFFIKSTQQPCQRRHHTFSEGWAYLFECRLLDKMLD